MESPEPFDIKTPEFPDWNEMRAGGAGARLYSLTGGPRLEVRVGSDEDDARRDSGIPWGRPRDYDEGGDDDRKATRVEHQEEARPNFSRVGDIGMASWPIPVSPEELDHLAGQVRVSAVETASASSREGRTGTRPGSLTPRPLSRADLSAKVLAKWSTRRRRAFPRSPLLVADGAAPVTPSGDPDATSSSSMIPCGPVGLE